MISPRLTLCGFHQGVLEERIKFSLSENTSTSSINGRIIRSKEPSRKCKQRQRFPGRKEWESQTSKNASKARYCSVRISSIVQVIESADDVYAAMQPWAGKLESKDQSRLLKELRDWPKALQVFGWLQEQENYSPDVILYNIVLRILGKAQQWGHVRSLWQQLLEELEPTNVTYSTLVDVYGRAGLKEEALYFYKHMKEQGLQPDEVMVSTFINLQRRFGDLEAAEGAFLDLLDGSGTKPKNPATYNTMLALYGEHEHYEKASKLFSFMHEAQVQPTVVTFNTMINIYGKTGRVKDAESLVDRMMLEPDCTPDIATYNSLLDMYVRNEMLEDASDCLRKMRDAGVCPDRVTYRSLISGYASKGWVRKAEDAVKAMESSGFFVDQATYVQIILMYIKTGQASKSVAVFQFLHSRDGLDVSTYVSVLDAYAEAGWLAEAEEVYELWQKGPTEKCAAVFNVMIKAYGLSSVHSDKAFEIFDRMGAAGVKPNDATFNSVIQLICKRGLVQDLEKFLLQAQVAGCVPSLACYSSMISLYANSGSAKKAEKAFREMEEAGIKADRVCYSALLNAYAEAGFAREAQETLEAMKTAGFTPDPFVSTSLMKLYGNLGLVNEAEVIHAEMTKRGPNAYASTAMVSIYLKAGMLGEAEKLFKAMKENASINEVACTVMLNHYRDTGRTEDAIALAKQMQELELLKDVPSYNSVISSYAKSGLMLEALQALSEMKDRGFVANKQSFSFFEDVLEKAGVSKDPIHNLEGASHLEMLVILCSLYGQAEMIKEAVDVAREIAGKAEETLDVGAYNVMIFAFGKAGMLEAALKTYMQMQRRGVRMNEATYASVIAAYGKAGLVEGVARMFKRLKQAGYQPRVSTYKSVIDIYRQAGRMDLASMVSQELQLSQYIRSGMRSRHSEDDQYPEDTIPVEHILD